MNILSWLVVAAVFAVVGYVAVWDEEPGPGTVAWLSSPAISGPAAENGYFSLMGLFAGTADESRKVGRKRVQAYELARAAQPTGAQPSYTDYPAALRLATSAEIETLCKVEKRTCMHSFVADADTVRALSHNHRLLLQRYAELAEFQLFQSTTTPSVFEPQVPVELLSTVQRLLNAGIAVEFATGSRLRAVEQLAEDIRFQRRLLAGSDQLEVKLMAIESLARDLHLLSEFLDSAGFVHRHLPDLAAELNDLTTVERHLEPAIRREFKATADAMATLPSSTSIGLDIDVPQWMTALLYKPNATLNRLQPRYAELVVLAASSHREFVVRWQKPQAVPPPTRLDYLLNPIGSVLVEIWDPSPRVAIAAVNDIAGLIRLLRLKRDFHAGSARDVESFLNTGGNNVLSPHSGGPVLWDRTRQVLYFDGLSDKDYLKQVGLVVSP